MDSGRRTLTVAAQLAVSESIKRYSAVAPGLPREAELLVDLQRAAASTQRRPLKTARQLMLSGDGHTLDGFRYSINALRQMCRLLGRGFSQAIFDLGAVIPSQSPPDDGPYDATMAVQWLNDLIRLRFEKRIKNYELIVGTKDKVIDGFVGARYAYVSNMSFYERAKRVVRPTNCVFHEAVLASRRLLVRYRTEDPVFTLEGEKPEPFYGGFHFGNSEVGDCAVRTAVLLLRQRGDCKSVSSYSDNGRVLHIRGPQFEERLSAQLGAVVERIDEPRQLQTRLESLRSRPLGLVGGEEDVKRRLSALSRRLKQWGLQGTLAQRVLGRVQLLGSSLADEKEREPVTAARSSRTEWDLFNAMTFMAKRQQLETQERLEQLAYQLLIGRKTIS